MKNRFLKINLKDNVLVALQDLEKGSRIEHDNVVIELQEMIPERIRIKYQQYIDWN